MNESESELARPRKSLLMVSFEQFGYHTDSYEYCRYLADRYRITYLCPDQDLPRQELDGVEVLYRQRPPLGKVELGLLVETDRLLRRRQFMLVVLRRTKFSFLLRLRHPRTPFVFDVRSGSIEENRWRRTIENGLLRLNAGFFPHVTVISSGLAGQLGLAGKAHVVPLGADPQPVVEPIRNELRLVYVGTFKNRHLERTVEGLGRFAAAASRLPVRFTLIGFGSDEERAAIGNAAASAGLGDRVQIRDRMDRADLPAVLAEHNVGVAFTPQVPWFEHQPSTKVFEYLQCGLLCIASDNHANREVISPANGVLVSDTAEGFRRGLEQVVEMLGEWSPREVADGVRDHTWRAIVNNNLAPYLEGIAS